MDMCMYILITACLSYRPETEIKLHVKHYTGLKVNDQLVAYATRFLAVRLKNYVRSQHRAFKAKVQCDFSSAYSPDHTNIRVCTLFQKQISRTFPGLFQTSD